MFNLAYIANACDEPKDMLYDASVVILDNGEVYHGYRENVHSSEVDYPVWRAYRRGHGFRLGEVWCFDGYNENSKAIAVNVIGSSVLTVAERKVVSVKRGASIFVDIQ